MLSWLDKFEFNNTEVWLDNEALSHYCREKGKIADPSFGDINRLIVEQVSSFTHGRRFGGGTGFKNFRELDAKLICYPRYSILTAARSFTSEA